MKKISFILLITIACTLPLSAAAPSGYYTSASGKSGKALYDALSSIITHGHKKLTYTQLWSKYGLTDVDDNNHIMDMYSTCTFVHVTNKCGSYNDECDCYNREHTAPKSWWGSDADSYMYTDIVHVIPTDGYVNSKRSSYPIAECSSGTKYGTCRLGTSSVSGISGKVWEPADEYKGDFARIYFYMATRYASQCSSWGYAFGSNYGLSSAYKTLYLKWHRADPVSEKEIKRNDGIQSAQGNRNPYVDYPELVEYIWGNKSGSTWTEPIEPDEESEDIIPIQDDVESNYYLPYNFIKSREVIQVKADNDTHSFNYWIYDVHGILWAAGSNFNFGDDIDVSRLPNGIYAIRLSIATKGKSKTEKKQLKQLKFIIQK